MRIAHSIKQFLDVSHCSSVALTLLRDVRCQALSESLNAGFEMACVVQGYRTNVTRS